MEQAGDGIAPIAGLLCRVFVLRPAQAACAALSSASRNTSSGSAPAMAYWPSKMKNGTPWTPSRPAELPIPCASGYSHSMHQHGDLSILRLPLAGALALGLLLLRLAR